MEAILHYTHDPLCGWCYAAEAPTDAASRHAPGPYTIKLHAGGLFSRTRLSNAKRSHIHVAVGRIGELTGQVFGEPYLKGLLSDPNTTYDSSMPIRGILAAEAVKPGSEFAMLKALQRAHYRSGLRIVEAPTIAGVAESVGLGVSDFAAAFERISEDDLAAHLENTHRLMQKVGARGYPMFVAQSGERFAVLPHDQFYGDAERFADLVLNTLAPEGANTEHRHSNVQVPTRTLGSCDGGSCEL